MAAMLSRNIEDYLKTIFIIEKEKKVPRLKDISRRLGVSMPSVHSALHVLEKNRIIKHEHYGYIQLTDEGRVKGEKIYSSHNLVMKLLTDILGVDSKTAEKDACNMEHGISTDTVNRILSFFRFVQKHSEDESGMWLKKFPEFYRNEKKHAKRRN